MMMAALSVCCDAAALPLSRMAGVASTDVEPLSRLVGVTPTDVSPLSRTVGVTHTSPANAASEKRYMYKIIFMLNILLHLCEKMQNIQYLCEMVYLSIC